MSTKKLSDISVSVLDLVPIQEGKTAADAIKNAVDLAQHVEKLGYRRFWMAEHHNFPGIASSATTVLIGHVARETSTIRVGSGGIMLPNHAPLVVAEQFGTLATLFPGRIDLGLGRAPGTDGLTAMALRRDQHQSVDEFPQNVVEVYNYLGDPDPSSKVRAVPGEGTYVPIWILGSSTFGAQLAGMLGMPYAFASHFAPTMLHHAIQVYRDSFKPVGSLKEPYVMAGVNVIAADTDEKADYLATSMYQSFLGVIRGTAGLMKPPVESMNGLWDASEQYAVQNMLRCSFVGSPEKVKEDLQKFVDQTQVDEVIVASSIYDHAARLHSYELIADFFKKSA
ncbi:LLM class flavin-dependent oxidoreductase [Rufibacter hautae]|uniref:Luciferase-like monooxygenase n=1 Tax=Rufibacter hautae TaxID=2595005 RepID=A0A5B6TF85_9BACT|nr:LLM class flavin-dependent oxidoreductase [Rufibacter hautae]KAA3439262.1 LLM class flavin-dependent oxidoreductase [Rufibacter hautae]